MKSSIAIFPMLLVLVLFGCGDGGGGEEVVDDGDGIDEVDDGATTEPDSLITPLVYSGNTQPAVLTAINAKYLVDLYFGSDDPSICLCEGAPEISQKTVSSTVALTSILSTSSKQLVTANLIIQESIDQLVDCSVSGTLHTTGTVFSDYSADLILDYDNCDDGDIFYHGVVYMTYSGLNIYFDFFTDARMSFDLLHAKGDFGDVTSTGSITILFDVPTATETTNSNIIVRDNISLRFSKSENLVLETTYDYLYSPSSQVKVSGLFFDELEGYVVLSTTNPLSFSDPDQQYPYDGGPLCMAGANNSQLRITPTSETEISINLDEDGDGIFEAIAITDWLSLSEESEVSDNTEPVADAGDDISSVFGNTVELDGSGSYDPDGDFIWFSWAVIHKPADSNIPNLLSTDYAIADFTPDVPGAYTISLTVNDGTTSSPASTMFVNSYETYALEYRVVDAEYSPQLERLVMVSDTPPTLHIYDVDTNTESTVTLSLPPAAVSVSPDGMFAAVGHEGWISYVNLHTPTLVDTLVVNADVQDIVLAGNGYVYAFPRTERWDYMRAIEIATGTETTLPEGDEIHNGTKAKLHPGGLAIYGADNFLYPSDIEKYSIENGTPDYLYDSPYQDGQYEVCGDLWISEDGADIFTKCGNVFRSSVIESEDMTYRGSLSTITDRIVHADHSAEVNSVAAIPDIPWWTSYTSEDCSDYDTEVHIFDSTFLALQKIIKIPALCSNGTANPLHGRFVFYDSNGERTVLVVQSNPDGGLESDFFVMRF